MYCYRAIAECNSGRTKAVHYKPKTGHLTGCPVSFQPIPNLCLARHGRPHRRRQGVHHVVLVLAGVSGGIVGLAAAGAAFGPGQPTAVADALETGVAPTGRMGLVGFGEVCVNVVPAGAAAATPAA